ncbi:hypothetical protein L218DRAFT_1059889 [Marasmius fiardii PR-910]|nr:hypothetical protein L218DRAFT_1059889 [Marasmius fiardii PR-910]
MFRRKTKNPKPQSINSWSHSLNSTPSISGPSDVAPSAIPPSSDNSTSLLPPSGMMLLHEEDEEGKSQQLEATSSYNSTRRQSSLNDHGLWPYNPIIPSQNMNNLRTMPPTHLNQTTTYWGHHTEISGDHNHNIINNFSGSQVVNKADPDSLQLLWQAIADVGATHNSEVRYPPPKCHADTRKEVRQKLMKQIDGHAGPRVYWLSGPAGVGKSAVAQTIAEDCEKGGKLVASFFFSRYHPKRNVPTFLFLTIAYGLASSIPKLRDDIAHAIKSNPALLHTTLEHQFAKLITEPCSSFGGQGAEWGSFPRLVVIDGLDECNGGELQTRVLSIIAKALNSQTGLPLQFLICSRPEPTIKEFFDSKTFHPYLRCYFLHDDYSAREDIKAFLSDGFNTIRSKPRYHHLEIPELWPSSQIIWSLVQKSCGQFIYPSTILKYVDDEFSDPRQRLDIILGLAPRLDTTSPFQDLDLLYHHIVSVNPNRKQLLNVLGIILSWPHLKPQFITNWPSPSFTLIEMLLNIQSGQVALTLRGMHSVLQILKPNNEIKILHASFSDFLTDQSRSMDFCIDQVQYKSFTISQGICLLNNQLSTLPVYVIFSIYSLPCITVYPLQQSRFFQLFLKSICS